MTLPKQKVNIKPKIPSASLLASLPESSQTVRDAPKQTVVNRKSGNKDLPVQGFTPLEPSDLLPVKLPIPTDFQPLYIVHLSDIHVPINLHIQRSTEYDVVFNNLYTELEKLPLQRTLIIITGDLVNTKLRTENETLVVAQNFLRRLSSMTHTIVIIGNHDFAENNPARMDSITAICHTLPQIHVLKKTGIYVLSGLTLVFNSLFDLKFIRRSDVNIKDSPVYALYHGSIVGASHDNGNTVDRPKTKIYPSLRDLEGYDAVLLGHLHLRQFLKPHIGYAGSLIQQKFGEHPTEHGYILWNTSTHRGDPVNIYNPYVQLIVKVHKGQIVGKDRDVLESLRDRTIKLRCDLLETTNSEFELLKESLQQDYQISAITSKHLRTSHKKGDIVLSDKESYQISVDDEFKILAEMIKPDIQTEILTLHQASIASHNRDSGKQHNSWYPLSMDFMNLFIYGHDYPNHIDFPEGVMDICSPNHTGKSSIIHTLIYALYNGLSSTKNARANILHTTASHGYVSLEFLCNGNVYHIRKELKKKPDGSVSSKTQFYQIEDDKKICLNGTSETQTLKEIQKYVGTKDQFFNNNMICSEYNASNILSMNPADLLRHFQKICNLGHYEEYENTAKTSKKELYAELTRSKALYQNICEQIQNLSSTSLLSEKESLQTQLIFMERGIDDIRTRRDQNLKQQSTVVSQIEELDRSLEKIDVPAELTKDQVTRELDSVNQKLETYGDAPESIRDLSESALQRELVKLTKSYSLIAKKIDESGHLEESIRDCRSKLGYLETTNYLVSSDVEPIIENIGATKNLIAGQKKILADLRKKISSLGSHESLDLESEGEEKEEGETGLPLIENKLSQLKPSINDLVTQTKGCTIERINQQLKNIEEGQSVNPQSMEEIQEQLARIEEENKLLLRRKSEFNAPVQEPSAEHTIESLLLLKKTLKEVPSKYQLSQDANERLQILQQQLANINLIDLPPIPIHHFENQAYVLQSDHVKYSESQFYQDRKKEYETLLQQLDHNKKVDQIALQNRKDTKYNEGIDAQIKWLEWQELIDAITINEQKKTVLLRYIKILTLKNILLELQNLQEQYNKLETQQWRLLTKEIAEREGEISSHTAVLCQLEKDKRLLEEYNELKHLLATLLQQKEDSETHREHFILLKEEIRAVQDQIEKLTLVQRQQYLHEQVVCHEFLEKKDLLQKHQQDLRETLQFLDLDLHRDTELLNNFRNNLTTCQNKLALLADLELKSEDYLLSIKKTESRHDILEEYARLMNYKGLPSVLLEKYLARFCATVNTIFQKYSNYSFRCHLQKDKKGDYTIELLVENIHNKSILDLVRLSGYESVLLNIAISKAILDLDHSFRSGIFIIDERLDCFDQNRFQECLPTILGILKEHFNTVVLVSHRDVPQSLVDTKIHINNYVTYSILEN